MPKLSFANLDQWDEIHRLRTTPPPADVAALGTWIHTQHVPTSYEARLTAAFDKLIRQHVGTNELWLAVSGDSHTGKSTAVTQVLLSRSRDPKLAWRTRNKDGYLSTPYVFVEAGSSQEARGLLASIARACGISDSGHEKELRDRLSELFLLIGTILIVVDEAQVYRRVSDSASRLVDGLRQLLHLPVPIAFVGIDLERSALLRDPGRNNDTVHQMRRRHFQVQLRPLRQGQGREAVALVQGFAARMQQVSGLQVDCLNDPRLIRDLTATVEGRPGSMLFTLKKATVEAIAEDDGVLTEERVRTEAADEQARVLDLRTSS